MRYYQMKKRFKTYAIVALCFMFVSLGLITWAAQSTIGYLVSATNQSLQKIQVSIRNSKIDEQFLGLSNFQPMQCLQQAQKYLSVQPWIENSLSHNFLNLKTGCFGSLEKICSGENCIQENDLLNLQNSKAI